MRPTAQCRKLGVGADKCSLALMPERKGLKWIQVMEFNIEPEEEFELRI